MRVTIECCAEGKSFSVEAECGEETTLEELFEKEFFQKCSAVCGRTVTAKHVKEVKAGEAIVADWAEAPVGLLRDEDRDSSPLVLRAEVMNAAEARAWAAAYEAKKKKVIAALVERGREQLAHKRVKDGWATFQSIRKMDPDDFDGLLYTTLLMTNTGIEVRLRDALELAQRAERLYPDRFNIPVIIGDIHMDLRNYAAAEKAYAKAYEMLRPMFEPPPTPQQQQQRGGRKGKGRGKNQGKGKGGVAAGAAGAAGAVAKKTRVEDEGIVEVYVKAINRGAEAALRGGNIEHAEELLRRAERVDQKDSTQTELVQASIDYARAERVFARNPSQSFEYALRAMKARLEAAVSHAGLAETKHGFNESLGGKFGLRALYKALDGLDAKGPRAAASFSMLGTLGRDEGNFAQCIDLYTHGLALRPDYAYCALHTAHCYEALTWYAEAVRSHLEFFEANPELGVFTATCANVLGVVAPLRRVLGSTSKGRPEHPDMGIAPGTPQPFREPPKGMVYPEEEISVLGMYFTLAKYLYVMGFLQFLAPLGKIIHPLRENSDVHFTAVVNEAAYYGCIEKLAADVAPRLPLDTECPSIYALGDSHTLAMGWNHVVAAGTKFLIRPYLVTGIKAYHLRQNTRFYPKETFWNVARTIPAGAYTIVSVGEIDCREAILSAIDKGGYRSMEEGVAETLRCYIPALQRLARDMGLRVMVHPAPPVQDGQRELIRIFNATLKERIATLGNPNIKYLDIDNALVLEGWTGFNKKYALDGTHLKANYVPEILEPAINKAISEWEGK